MARKQPRDFEKEEEIEGIIARDLKAFGVRLREARLKAGMTQHQLATKAHASHAYIYELESGIQNLTFSSMAKLAYACGVAIRDLLPETDDAPATAASIEVLCSMLKQLGVSVAEFQQQDVRRQAVQGNLIERLRAFADMGASLERLLHPAENPLPAPIPSPTRRVRKGRGEATHRSRKGN